MSEPENQPLIPALYRVRQLAQVYHCETLLHAQQTASALTDGDWSMPAVIDEWCPKDHLYKTRCTISDTRTN